MKFTFNHPTHITTSKRQTGVVAGETYGSHHAVVLMLIILVIALASCSPPQKKSLSGAQADNNASGITDTPTNQADAGGATLNLLRHASFDYPAGSDVQSEEGAIQLVFSKSTEEGDLIVEGKGKTEWTEVTNFKGCSYTAKAEGKITVTGIFSEKDCLFHLTIATKFSQPTTTYQDQSSNTCLGGIHFNQTEFSSLIELDPDSDRVKETGDGSWWQLSTVSLSDLKSEVVKMCFKPVEIILPK